MNEKRLTEEEVRKVLDRAAQLEERREGLTAEELIEIGVEAGYSRRAMEKAVEESRLPEEHDGGGAPPSGDLVQGFVQAAGVGSLVGASTAAGYLLEWEVLVGGSIFIGIPLVVLLAVAAGGRRAHALFQLGNGGFWIGYLVALGILSPVPAMGWFIVVIPILAAILALLGVGIVEGRWRIGGDAPPDRA